MLKKIIIAVIVIAVALSGFFASSISKKNKTYNIIAYTYGKDSPSSSDIKDIIKSDKDYISYDECDNETGGNYLHINKTNGWIHDLQAPEGPVDEVITVSKAKKRELFWQVWFDLDAEEAIIMKENGAIKRLPLQHYSALKDNEVHFN